MNKTKLITIALDLIKCLKELQTARGAQILDLKKKQIALETALRACLEAPPELDKEDLKEGPNADDLEKLATREAKPSGVQTVTAGSKILKETKTTKGSPTVNQNITKSK